VTLFLSFYVLAGAATLGTVLVVLHGMRRTAILRFAGPLHGLIGATGLGLLLVALRGPPRGVTYGVSGFGTMAAVLLSLGVLAGLGVLARRLRRRDPMLAIGVHATLAIFGFVLLAAYASVPA
jgi:hypothetical protein